MPKKGIEPLRRQQLIDATFQVIHEIGLADATVATIARKAGLSTGIVAHYFGDKAGLLNAAMRQILSQLKNAFAQHRGQASADPRSQLRALVDANFDPSQTSGPAMRVWLTFWAASMHQPELARLQRINDQRLYSNLAYQFRRSLPAEPAREAARGLAALIDGLWLRGSLVGGQINGDNARHIAYAYIDFQLQANAL
ncbi:transcriptional regulator BetI [Stenotrophomonas sp. ZAC14D2_NAIMI4_7]|uniref:transcriptional regulator BetI n=1 Tax=Stenotrophomonas sp. ZAC14D2_NAIMI4_7 TaxID=2072405 RepID=UPI000D53D036|nr:transcriptional regulator BetI [Stenotrophomonas sp. ZAC14D2_NAIMI4_7]AWH17508.1 transcriptional regulator BetI [Stenotrophomonas sp. ZAC14D2_NAIMI4_7]